MITNENEYFCDWCGKKFPFEDNNFSLDDIYFYANDVGFCCKECFENYYEKIPGFQWPNGLTSQ